LIQAYWERGVEPDAVSDWPVAALLGGLLAECCNVLLTDIVDGYPTKCAFPGVEHACEADVFKDVFARWAARQIPPPGVVAVEGFESDRGAGRTRIGEEAGTGVPATDDEGPDPDDLAGKSLRALRAIAVNEIGYDRADLAGLDKETLIELILSPEEEDSEEEGVSVELTGDDLRAMSIAELKDLAEEIGVRFKSGVSKVALVDLILQSGEADDGSPSDIPDLLCPRCGQSNVLPIVWGMPAGDPRPGVIVAGCVIEDGPLARFGCAECGWHDTDPVDPTDTDASLLRAFPAIGAAPSVAGIPGIVYAYQNRAAWQRLKATMKPKPFKALKKSVDKATRAYVRAARVTWADFP